MADDAPYPCFFFFNDTATTEIYTLSLHDALPISRHPRAHRARRQRSAHCARHTDRGPVHARAVQQDAAGDSCRSEEHTSELQSPDHLVCRLLLEQKKTRTTSFNSPPPSYLPCHTS